MNKKFIISLLISYILYCQGLKAETDQPLKIDSAAFSLADQFSSDEPIEITKNESQENLLDSFQETTNNENKTEEIEKKAPEGTSDFKTLSKLETLELYGDQLFEDYEEPLEPARQALHQKSFKALSKDLINEAGQQEKGAQLSSSNQPTKMGTAYLSDYLEPWKNIPEDKKNQDGSINSQEDKIEITFENIDLKQFVDYLANLFQVTFITDGDFDPIPQNGKQLVGNKITFSSHTPLSKKEVWDIGLAFLEMAGFSVVPEPALPRTYRITASSPTANQEPLPTFIGVNPELLPNNDSKIRYIYFVNNADLKTIGNIINEMISTSAGKPIIFNDLRAVMLTDKASNIRSIMSIVTELDTVSRPEVLSIVRLQRAEAAQIADLFNKELLASEDKRAAFTFGPAPKKAPTTRFFSDRVRVIAEPQRNTLIILGPQDAVSRVEDFITQHIDREIDLPYSPLHIYRLKHLNTEAVSGVLNQLVTFGGDSLAAQTGGVRNFDQFFKRTVQIFPEPAGNNLIIKADYEDYLKLKNTIDQLDVEQAQVGLKVLILNVDMIDNKQLGAQLRNRIQECNQGIFKDVSFQSALIGPIVERPTTASAPNEGAVRLLGNLLQLVTGQSVGQAFGETLVTLGRDAYGVWGLLQALETYTRTSIIANPFLITTHKYPAIISVGESRRVQGNTVTAVNSVTGTEDESALLTVEITPIISYDDMITLNIYVALANFTQDASVGGLRAGDKTTRYVQTSALVADNEVLALGGLTQDRVEEVTRVVPILGYVPLIGNLFRYKSKIVTKNNFLILITPQIIRPDEQKEVALYTQDKINEAKEVIFEGKDPHESRMPFVRWFFKDYKDKEAATIDKFVSRQSRYLDETQKANIVPLALSESSQNTTTQSILDLIPQKNREMTA